MSLTQSLRDKNIKTHILSHYNADELYDYLTLLIETIEKSDIENPIYATFQRLIGNMTKNDDVKNINVIELKKDGNNIYVDNRGNVYECDGDGTIKKSSRTLEMYLDNLDEKDLKEIRTKNGNILYKDKMTEKIYKKLKFGKNVFYLSM